MMVLRIDEVYESVQGEGPRVGRPTVFLRFGGCNLRCPGWPCDTQHAIDPAFRMQWVKSETEDVVARVEEARGKGTTTVCLTGGEPFVQRDRDLLALVRALAKSGVRTIECFSNGTIEYPEWAFDWINFVMDWKLPGSGEDYANEVRLKNLERLSEGDAVKFVIKDEHDFDVAMELYDQFLADRPELEVFYGVAWGHLENDELVKWVLARGLPWRLNVQVHNHIWDRNKRGI